LHHFIFRFYKHIIVLSGILTLFALILASQLKLDLNLLSLLPSENTSVKTFFEISDDVGVQSVLVAMVEPQSDFSQRKTKSFVDLIAKKIRQSKLISEVEYRSGERQLRSLDTKLVTYLPLILNKVDLKKLAARLSDAGIKEQIKKNRMFLMTPFGIAMKEGIDADPLGFRDFLMPALATSSGKLPAGQYQGYYRTTDERTYFLFIKPKKPPQDITFSKKLMAEVHHIERVSLSELSEKNGDPAGKFKISYTGGYPIAISDEATTKSDMKVILTTSFLGVLFLFGLSF
jgi:predicted exporter